MPTVTVAKKFDFHAAHRLPHHEGKCRRLHGHTYGLEIAVTGPVKPANGESDEGMVQDFGALKDLYKMLVEPYVEHQFLNETLAKPDLEVPFPLWTKPGDMTEETGMIPLTTAEGLAVWIQQTYEHGLFTLLGMNDLHHRIQTTVWETPTSYAQVGSVWRGSDYQAVSVHISPGEEPQ